MPNASYDPVRVATLDAAHVEAVVADALAAFAAATTPAELKQARLAHAAERSPIALANREIGALPPAARKEAGARVGQARGRINAALQEREAEIKEAELARILVEERVDVTRPVQPGPVPVECPGFAVAPVAVVFDRQLPVRKGEVDPDDPLPVAVEDPVLTDRIQVGQPQVDTQLRLGQRLGQGIRQLDRPTRPDDAHVRPARHHCRHRVGTDQSGTEHGIQIRHRIR